MTLRLIPFLFVLYVFNYLDRQNVGFAALQMNSDLGLSPAAFSFGAGIFFIGYSLFQVPSSLMLVRVGARRWMSRIMIAWGVLAVSLMFVKTPAQFYVVRFLLGVAEAGFFPAIIYYLGQWYPMSMRARATAWFMTAIPLSGLLGGPLGGWLLNLNGKGGLAGWQWLFLVEGLPSVILGVVILSYLTEKPAEARWLSDEQRAWLSERLQHDRDASLAPHGRPPLRALLHPLIWLVAIPQLPVTTVGYVYFFWGPTMLRDALHLSNLAVGWLTGAISVLCAIGVVAVGASSDRTGDRIVHAAACALVVAVGCAGAGGFGSPVARMASLVVAQIAVISFLAPFCTIPMILLSGSSAAVGIALVNAIGNIAGFIGPNIISSLRSRTTGDAGAFFALSAAAFAAALMCYSMRWSPAIRGRR